MRELCYITYMYNYRRDIREATRAHDAQFFTYSVQRKQEMDPSFKFSYNMDDDNRWNMNFGRTWSFELIIASLVMPLCLIQRNK